MRDVGTTCELVKLPRLIKINDPVWKNAEEDESDSDFTEDGNDTDFEPDKHISDSDEDEIRETPQVYVCY